MSLPVTPDDIRAAHARISAYIRHHVLISLAALLGHDGLIYLKLESIQHPRDPSRHMGASTTCSLTRCRSRCGPRLGGNHGPRWALCRAPAGIPAHIFSRTLPEGQGRVTIPPQRCRSASAGLARMWATRVTVRSTSADRTHARSISMIGRPLPGQALSRSNGKPIRPVSTGLVAAGGGGLVSGIRPSGAGASRSFRRAGLAPAPCMRPSSGRGGRCERCTRRRRFLRPDCGDSRPQHLQGGGRSCCASRGSRLHRAQHQLWRDYRIASEPGGASPPWRP